MKIIDLNEIILGNVELKKSKTFTDLPDYTENIKRALDIGNGLYNKDHLKSTKSNVEFYEANPLFEASIDDWYEDKDVRVFKKELFYSMLCNAYVPHIPTELLAVFLITRSEVETPNQMIAALDRSKMRKYLTTVTSSNPNMLKELLDSVWGYEVNLVTKNRPLVTNKDVVEIYIENINEILICNPSITTILADVEDVKSLSYSKDKGIIVGEKEIPLRTLIHSYGITVNDLDLRNVFLANES